MMINKRREGETKQWKKKKKMGNDEKGRNRIEREKESEDFSKGNSLFFSMV